MKYFDKIGDAKAKPVTIGAVLGNKLNFRSILGKYSYIRFKSNKKNVHNKSCAPYPTFSKKNYIKNIQI